MAADLGGVNDLSNFSLRGVSDTLKVDTSPLAANLNRLSSGNVSTSELLQIQTELSEYNIRIQLESSVVSKFATGMEQIIQRL